MSDCIKVIMINLFDVLLHEMHTKPATRSYSGVNSSESFEINPITANKQMKDITKNI